MEEPARKNIDTVIDRLYDYVKLNKRTTVSSASSALAIPSDQVEKFAGLLEQSGLVKVNYALTHTEIVLAEEHEKKPRAISIQDSHSHHSSAVSEQMKSLEREVMKSESLLEFLENDLTHRIKLAEDTLLALEKTGGFTSGDIAFMEKEIKIIEGQLQHFKSRISELNATEYAFQKKIVEFDKRLFDLDRIEKQAQIGGPNLGFARKAFELIGLAVDAAKKAILSIIPKLRQKQLQNTSPQTPLLGQSAKETQTTSPNQAKDAKNAKEKQETQQSQSGKEIPPVPQKQQIQAIQPSEAKKTEAPKPKSNQPFSFQPPAISLPSIALPQSIALPSDFSSASAGENIESLPLPDEREKNEAKNDAAKTWGELRKQFLQQESEQKGGLQKNGGQKKPDAAPKKSAYKEALRKLKAQQRKKAKGKKH